MPKLTIATIISSVVTVAHGANSHNAAFAHPTVISASQVGNTITRPMVSSTSPEDQGFYNSDKFGNEQQFPNNDIEPEKELPKYSQSIPFLARPKELKFELAGDVGFDPLNFAKNHDLLMEYREAEIKHARLAMLAAAGWPVSELLDVQIASSLHMQPLLDSTDRVPSMFNGGMEKVSPVWWGFCLGLSAAIDLYGVNRARVAATTGEEYIPGDLEFDPLGLYPAEEDVEGRQRMQLAEIKHGRLAMIAVLAFSIQELVTQVGVVDETPFFFKPLIATARPFLESIANN